MKQGSLQIIFLSSLFLLFASCEKKIVKHELKEDGTAFLWPQNGESFKLLDQTKKDTITFTVQSTDNSFKPIREMDNITLGLKKDLYEKAEIKLANEKGCSGSVKVNADKNDSYNVYVKLSPCLDLPLFTEPQKMDPMRINGIEYRDVLSLKGYPNQSLYFSNQKGILQIVDNTNGEVLFDRVF